jgi:hypothetical protein
MRGAVALIQDGALNWLAGCPQPALFVVDPADGATGMALESWLATTEVRGTILAQRRPGLSGALNEALGAATTRYVHWCGADDEVYWRRYDQVARRAASEAAPTWFVGRCDTRRFDGRLTAAGTYRDALHRLTPWLLPLTNVIGCPGVIFRADRALAAGGFDEKVVAAMDYDLWLRLFAVEPPVVLPVALGRFTVHRGSLTRTHRRASIEDCYRARKRYFRRAWVAEAARGFQAMQLRVQDLLGE